MAEPYLTSLRLIVNNLRKCAADPDVVRCKHFFSGAAAYHNGKIFMSLSPAGLALKLSPADCEQLLEQGATSLRYFPGAPIKKGYVVLPNRLSSDMEILALWVRRGIAFVDE